MKLSVAGAGPTDGPTTDAERAWLRTLFAVKRAKKGTREEQLAVLAEENAWRAVQREKAAGTTTTAVIDSVRRRRAK